MRNLCRFGACFQTAVARDVSRLQALVSNAVAHVEVAPSSPEAASLAKAHFQCLANLCAGNTETQRTVWSVCFPGALQVGVASPVPAIQTVATMILYTCSRSHADFLAQVCSEAPRVFTDTALQLEAHANTSDDTTSTSDHDTDWAVFFLELVSNSPHFATVMKAVVDVPAQHTPDGTVEASSGSGSSSSTEDGGADVQPKPSVGKVESARGIQAKTATLKFLEARTTGAHIKLVIDGEEMTDTKDEHDPETLPLSFATLDYLLEKFQQLSYLVCVCECVCVSVCLFVCVRECECVCE